MKRLCVALTGLVALTGAAAAADLSRPRRRPTIPRPRSWRRSITGPGSISALKAAAPSAVRPGIAAAATISAAACIGATVGYNWQFNQVVAGVEGDFGWADINGTNTTNCVAGCKTSDRLARHRARPARLRRRPFPALHHRWRRVRRHQARRRRVSPRHRRTKPAGPWAQALKPPSSTIGPPRSSTSMSISAASIAD